MKIEVFGKANCAKCKSAKEKLRHLLDKARADAAVPLDYHDMGTIEGLAEGAFNDVRDVPTVIFRDDAGAMLARWDGRPPHSAEVQMYLASPRPQA